MTAALLLLLIDWTRFGGPSGSFQEPASEIREWPAGGPQKLWERPLGDGYSGIVAQGGALFTLYRNGSREVVIRLEAASGTTQWEFAYEAPVLPEFAQFGGDGPRATPLLAANRLITVGANGKVHCLDPATGKAIWKRDFYTDFRGSVRNSGYSPSPFQWRDLVILFPGGEGGAIAALRQSDGAVVWRKHSYTPAFATPLLTTIHGREQLVVLFGKEVAGLDPRSGDQLWSFPHANSQEVNVAQPVVVGDGLLFLSSAYDGACRLIRVSKENMATEVWTNRLLRLHHTNSVLVGGMLLGASGDFGPVPLTALDAETGKLLWRDRTFPKASLVKLGDRLLILDEEGTLALGVATPEGLRVLGKISALQSTAWTAPSVVGKRVYLRDRKKVAAYRFE